MSWRVSGRNACCGEAIGRWSIWPEAMREGSPPPRPCWLISRRAKRLPSSAATRRVFISRTEDGGRVEGAAVWFVVPDIAFACARGQAADDVALEQDSDDHERG